MSDDERQTGDDEEMGGWVDGDDDDRARERVSAVSVADWGSRDGQRKGERHLFATCFLVLDFVARLEHLLCIVTMDFSFDLVASSEWRIVGWSVLMN